MPISERRRRDALIAATERNDGVVVLGPDRPIHSAICHQA